MNNFDEVFKDAIIGIKKKKRRVRLSRFNAQDGIVSDTDEIKNYIPGQGIVHIQEVQAKILDCGHSAGLGLGHVADCGHTACAMCVEKFILECQDPGCFKRLCTVQGCLCCALYVDGVYSCKEHHFGALVGSFFSFIFLGGRGFDERLGNINNVYRARRMQIRGGNEKRNNTRSHT